MNSNADLESSIEAIIFVSKDPIADDKLLEILKKKYDNLTLKEIKRVTLALMKKWSAPEKEIGGGITLQKIANGYIFTTEEDQADLVSLVAHKKATPLSKTQLEVLSIVAYRQPITRVDIDEIRGVDSSFAVKKLMQFKLLKILGKSEGLGRPLLYGTSRYFLEFFALNSLSDLPTLKQFESLDSGEEQETVDINRGNISVKDLFKDSTQVFSQEAVVKSEEALKGLDEAILKISNLESHEHKK